MNCGGCSDQAGPSTKKFQSENDDFAEAPRLFVEHPAETTVPYPRPQALQRIELSRDSLGTTELSVRFFGAQEFGDFRESFVDLHFDLRRRTSRGLRPNGRDIHVDDLFWDQRR